MLKVDLRELTRGPVDTVGELAGSDPLFAGLEVTLAGPLRVSGRLQATGDERFYWHGALSAQVLEECRRCLAPVAVDVEARVGALFCRDREALDDPDSYVLAANATAIDLAPAIREELILAIPAYVVCREDCRGLCPQCGHDLNTGPCGCTPVTTSWRPLAALKDKLSNS
ncbi:MAG TPA: YceD family protein [Gemmatimonadales bacterium]|nr:YceD family protein [Gemmatimonadales bacterium]